LRPQLGVYVIHESLRLPDGDAEPDDATWAAIAERTSCHAQQRTSQPRTEPSPRLVSFLA
jgi:hypothetical protein